MKRVILFLLLVWVQQGFAQSITEWMSLRPIPIDPPALSTVKNVENKVFSASEVLNYSYVNIDDLKPEIDASGIWKSSCIEDLAVRLKGDFSGKPVVYYSATYLSNDEWFTGSIDFNLFNSAEVYVDGDKKLTYISGPKGSGAVRNVKLELVPGKHTIIVKSVVMDHDYQALFTADLKKDSDFEHAQVVFTTSPKRGKQILDILNGKGIGSVRVSPTGNYVIVQEYENIKGKTSGVSNVYRVDDKNIVYSFYGNSLGNINWLPGLDRISYMISEGNGNSLYIYDVVTKEVNNVFKTDGQIKNYTWSPDLSYIIYSTTEDYSEKKWELRKLDGIEDRQDYYRKRSFLNKYDINSGMHTRLTWGNLSTSLMSVNSDGSKIIFSTVHPDYNEYPYRKQSIYLMDMNSYAVDTLWKERIYLISCSFSPDGKQLLVSGAANAFGSVGENIKKGQIVNGYDTQLYIYDLTTREIKPLTKNFDPTIYTYYWHKNGNIYFIAGEGEYRRLFCYDGNNITHLEFPGDYVRSFSISEKGDEAFYIATTVKYPAKVYSFKLNDLNPSLWKSPSDDEYRNIVFGEVNEWDYNYKKGTVITGRYYLPADFDPSKKYPLIVYYYGGTTPVERNFGGRWPFNLYAANGYVVYVMQPSGAIGFGQEFAARHQNNWGKITADEIIASTKAFIKEHSFIDSKKVGCMGASYGGFTTMYLQTQTDMFACAISHAGISSISSYWGDGYWGYSYSTNAAAHSFPWNRKDIYVDQSPLFNADKVKTPILLLHGTVDTNVPTGESIQFYTALKLLGKDAELVLINNADHQVVDYNQRILWNNTIMAYFAKYLKNQPAWWESIYKDKNL